MVKEEVAKQMRRLFHLEKCPKCGGPNISGGVDLDENDDVVREYDFCFDCGYEWNIKNLSVYLGG